MESAEILVWVLFAMIVYVICAMPTKADVRKIASSIEAERANSWRPALEARLGQRCKLSLVEVMASAGSSELAGTVVDVDDEWVLVETTDKKGAVSRVAVRMEQVRSIDEQA